MGSDENIGTQTIQEEGVTPFLDYLLVLVKYKRMILLAVSGGFVLSCAIALLLVNVYVATARIVPPEDKSGSYASALPGAVELASLAGLSLEGSSGDFYVGLLKSRTISDAIIDTYNLMDVYDQEYRVKTYEALNDHVTITLGKDDGIISISVEDEDPVRAAALANAYVEELRDLNVHLNLSKAGRERVFLENRLALVKKDLSLAEENFRKFQENNHTFKLDDQTAAIIETISLLKGQLAGKEVQLSAQLTYLSENNPEIKALREGISQLKSQIANLETSSTREKSAGDIFIATSEVPALGVQYARYRRELKIQETLFELLTKQYELAKINEAKDTSTVQVIDEAVAPDKKSKPVRSLIVFLATLAAGLSAMLAAYVREFLERMSPGDQVRWSELKRGLWRRQSATKKPD